MEELGLRRMFMATEFRDENVTVGSFNPNCAVFRSTQPHDDVSTCGVAGDGS